MGFNPRPRAGGDEWQRLVPSAYRVSIHAPARGATVVIGIPNWLAKFQSTPPRGGRLAIVAGTATSFVGFNPRPRAGGDLAAKDASLPIMVSIHAPARGATYGGAAVIQIIVFQSTPPRGGRPRCLGNEHDHSGFNPRPRAGGDVHG